MINTTRPILNLDLDLLRTFVAVADLNTFAAAAAAYEAHRLDAGLPATWEIISAMAWAPAPGAPIREGGADLVAVPVSRIPIRRRA
mgnify:CR=1 FL=1